MYIDLSRVRTQIYSKRKMQKSLSITMLILVSLILSNTYDSSLLKVSSEEEIFQSAQTTLDHALIKKARINKKSIKQSILPSAESKEEDNILLVQTATELKYVILNDYFISINVPFSSWHANLRVIPHSNVASVTMNKQLMRELNYSLGLGENLLDVGLDVQHKLKGNSVRTNRHHIISITRHTRWLDVNGPHDQVCYIEQDCDLVIYDHRECGLLPIESWKPSATIDGFWQINCSKCSQEETCSWDQAQWVETETLVTPTATSTDTSLDKCVQEHQLLFLGDSTNRGIMQSLMEIANKTLFYAAKTHGFADYENVGLATNFSFTYYPAFWTKKQPTFAQTLHDLANNCISGKEEKTILIIGGVQWLTGSQIKELHNFTTRRGIPARNVYVKTHSSGFHVNTSYTSIFHSKKSLRRLVKHNKSLKDLASSYGFRVIDTLQMTQSRFKEFLQGACACHFHQVNKISIDQQISNSSWIYSSLHELGMTEKLPPLIQYHISGSIHNAYTNKLIRALCADNSL